MSDWSARLLHADCLDAMAALEAESVHSIVCDPPAGISFMGKDWDHDRGGRERWIEWLAERMAEALRVAKPGAHALVWALPRTSHWAGTAVEDAGWEVRDVVTHLFGEGFPKSLDVSRAIDKAAGAEREDAGERVYPGGHVQRSSKDKLRPPIGTFNRTGDPRNSHPATEEAARWEGYGTGLKPSAEFWFLARKPFPGVVAANVLEHGTGALNLRGCEIGAAGGTKLSAPKSGPSGRESTTFGASIGGVSESDGGRWPANTVLSHDPRCEGNGPHHTEELCVEDCPVALLNEQSGESSSSLMPLPKTPGDSRGQGHGNRDGSTVRGHNDVGGAARFFYVAKPRTREKIAGTMRNLHPTAKGVQLMRYLARLVTPPGGVILDPFMGSGSTGCAAMAEGFRFIGVERDEDSFATSLARISDYAFVHGRERPAVG